MTISDSDTEELPEEGGWDLEDEEEGTDRRQECDEQDPLENDHQHRHDRPEAVVDATDQGDRIGYGFAHELREGRPSAAV